MWHQVEIAVTKHHVLALNIGVRESQGVDKTNAAEQLARDLLYVTYKKTLLSAVVQEIVKTQCQRLEDEAEMPSQHESIEKARTGMLRTSLLIQSLQYGSFRFCMSSLSWMIFGHLDSHHRIRRYVTTAHDTAKCTFAKLALEDVLISGAESKPRFPPHRFVAAITARRCVTLYTLRTRDTPSWRVRAAAAAMLPATTATRIRYQNYTPGSVPTPRVTTARACPRFTTVTSGAA
jgi:hypothetical protein